jgi:5-deoxy-glucuronate isomerase
VSASLVARGRDTDLIDLRLVSVAARERESLRETGEMCAVVLAGAVAVEIDGTPLGTAARGGDVFDSPPVAVYVPPAQELELVSLADAVVAVASAPVGAGKPGAARIIGPGDTQLRTAGTGNWSRSVRTILGPGADAGRLVVGETISPPGNWSSYPPHKHDRHAPPDEAALEEVYFYRFKPTGGFGVQLLYDDRHERALVVGDGDAVTIRSGYHPVVAAPGYALYYLWVMAGEGRDLVPYLDPQHAWVQEEAP